jgi:2,4-dienoyl-CoA reductase-like NADH-dependent reductase (Old Yellow Enzyme family)
MLFEPFTIGNVAFKNRILRSSIGGRTSYYDGTVTSAFKHFEERFARHGVAGIISATIAIDERRLSPLEYPKLSDDGCVAPLAEAIRAVQRHDCRYIVQIGDTGGHTHTALFPKPEASKSASGVFDLFYGYTNRHRAMSQAEIADLVGKFAAAARRVREAGADGVEVTASKGYVIHQFLNPATNRRRDAYGGSREKRFRLLEEVVTAVRRAVGADFLFGIRLSAADLNYLPLNLRWPPVFPLRDALLGNTVEDNLAYARRLAELGVDYLHIDKGFGFPNPFGNPGRFPAAEYRMFVNANRHLSAKAKVRAMICNGLPLPVLDALANVGWKARPAVSAEDAGRFRREIGLPVIANGGFQSRTLIEETLRTGRADFVAMARPLLANVDLVEQFRRGVDIPENPCTHCNRCPVRTANFPLGCYDPSRFTSTDEMERQILAWSATSDERMGRSRTIG